jgi:hypothetical protein
MQLDIAALHQNGTWDLVPCLLGNILLVVNGCILLRCFEDREISVQELKIIWVKSLYIWTRAYNIS